MDKPNDFRTVWLNTPVKDRRRVADQMGTSYRYLQRISGGFAKPSLDFALRLQKHFPTIDLAGFDRAVAMAGKRAR